LALVDGGIFPKGYYAISSLLGSFDNLSNIRGKLPVW